MTLNTLLKKKGIKQKWLAKQLNVSETTVSSWCTGKSMPRNKHAKKIASLLDVAKEELDGIK